MSVYEVPHAVIVIKGCVGFSWLFAAFYSQSTIRKCLLIIAAGTGCKFLRVSAELMLQCMVIIMQQAVVAENRIACC